MSVHRATSTSPRVTPVRSRFVTNASMPRLTVAALCASLIVSVGAVVFWTGGGGDEAVPGSAPGPAPAAAPVVPVTPAKPAKPGPQGTSYVPLAAASAPVRLQVPKLGVDAPVFPIELSSDAVLTPPADPQAVGYWSDSAEPGADSGQTVITGHTVHTGGGAFDNLDTLTKGNIVDIVTEAGTLRYRVQATEVLSKADIVTYAQNLFGQDRGDGRLILVTCDDWNGSEYESNAVSLAIPVGQPVPAPAPAANASVARFQQAS